MKKQTVLKILRDINLTNLELQNKYKLSLAEIYAICNAGKYLTVKEIADNIANVQPWMLSSDIEKVMGVPDTITKKMEDAMKRLREIFGIQE